MANQTAQAGRHFVAQPGEEVSDGLIVRLREGARLTGAKVPARFLTASRWQSLGARNLYRIQVAPADQFAAGEALANDPAVELVEPDRIRHTNAFYPDDPGVGEWNLRTIRAFEAFSWFPGRHLTSPTSPGRLRVAVLDSGADCTHPDFANAGYTSTDTVNGGQLNWLASSAIKPTTLPSPACSWQDDNGHGTAVAGLVAAATNNGLGIVSLGYMLELAIFKVAGTDGVALDSALIQGITNAVDGGAKVITISLSGSGYSQVLQDAVDYAWERNVIVIAAVGNDGSTAREFPAACNHVVGVGAFDTNGFVASFSNRGTPVDIAAPGVSVKSTSPVAGSARYNASYASVSGTSMAAPQVAALAGLLATASPGALADDVVRRIERSADLPTDGWSRDLGYGRIDAERAITGANWRVSTTGSVSGQIQDSAGIAIQGVRVTLYVGLAANTDSTGLFRFTGVAPGDYSMSVTLPAQFPIDVPVTISPGADTPIHLRLGLPHGTLRGSITASGVPAAGVTVVASRNGAQRAVAITNSLGQYSLFAPAGTYEVRAGGLFMTLATATNQTVVAATVTNVPPLAVQNFGRLEGTVRDTLNVTVPDAQIILAQSGRSFGAVSGATGDYRTIPAPSGTYQASAEEYSTGLAAPATVSIVDNTNLRLDMVLRNLGATAVSPATEAFSAIGGVGSATITSAAYLWRAKSLVPWIAVSTLGHGNSTLSYWVEPNGTAAARQGQIQINEAVLTVSQSVATAAVTVDRPSITAGHIGDFQTIFVFSSGEWVASPDVDWIIGFPSGGLAGTGNRSFIFQLKDNFSASSRTGRIRINNIYVTVTQLPIPITVSPTSVMVGGQVSTGILIVNSNVPGTPWTAWTVNDWITITGNSSGQGNGSITYRVAANPSTEPRSGGLYIPGYTGLLVSQAGGPTSVSPTQASMTSLGGAGSFTVTTALANQTWSAISQSTWISIASAAGSGSGNVSYQVAPNPIASSRAGTITVGASILTITQEAAPPFYTLTPSSASFSSTGGTGSFSAAGDGFWIPEPADAWLSAVKSSSSTADYQVSPNPTALARAGTIRVGSSLFTVNQAGLGASGGLHFVPVRPCRLADTRENLGPFGTPALIAGAVRSFPITSGPCGIPSTAVAFALNVTVVPKGPLGYLTIFPAGQTQPLVSTLNSIDGRIKANAAIVPAGSSGAISVFATNATELVLDINGYFVDALAAPNGALAFYPITPCRAFDTRNPAGALGGPILAAGALRSFPLLSANCGVPSTAKAFSVNATVVPSGPLSYLALWPTGQAQPLVSTLNALTGAIVANAAIVPAGDNGAITAYVTNNSHLLVDINGYFAPPGGAGAQRFFPVPPCRVLDTRNAAASLGGPILEAGQTRTLVLPASACGLQASATAYSLNATVVPTSNLSYLTLWPAGQSQPLVSTLNALDDSIVANAAIVVAGPSGSVSVYVTNQSHLVVDTNGYFAP